MSRPLPLLALLLAACAGKHGQGPAEAEARAIELVPLPVLVEPGEGTWDLGSGTAIVPVGAGAEAVADLLADALRPSTGLPLPVDPDDTGEAITLVVDPTLGLPAEGYTLDVDAAGVLIQASDAAGLFYGTQTLRQLLPAEAFAPTEVSDVDWAIPFVHIEDAPAFPSRGLMIDVARHFFGVDAVERQVDLMAEHKLNRLHLHLTDDQGWRIEIKSWPLLTEIGGSTEVGGGEGGWYTQDDYRAIVAYAAARFVTVVPEIDFPGHAHAALASYAELNESGVAEDLFTGEGVISTGLWLDGGSTPGFVMDVWHEVAALTPGAEVHVGGDEAVDSTAADYQAFVQWIQGVVNDEGKTMVGWDEIGDVPLAPPFVAQHWIDAERAAASVDDGGQLLASPAENAYLDMQYDSASTFGQTWAGKIDIEQSYSWDPAPDGVADADVIGVEGALWTEFIDSEEKLDFMVWPRLAAHAEVGWTPGDARDWEDFRDRLGWHGARLDAQGVGFYHSPEVGWEE